MRSVVASKHRLKKNYFEDPLRAIRFTAYLMKARHIGYKGRVNFFLLCVPTGDYMSSYRKTFNRNYVKKSESYWFKETTPLLSTGIVGIEVYELTRAIRKDIYERYDKVKRNDYQNYDFAFGTLLTSAD